MCGKEECGKGEKCGKGEERRMPNNLNVWRKKMWKGRRMERVGNAEIIMWKWRRLIRWFSTRRRLEVAFVLGNVHIL